MDLSQKRLERAQARFPDPGPLGNAPGVRFWHGDVADLPVYQGPFQAAFLNGAFESLRDPHETLARVLLRVAPGGHLVISHPQARTRITRIVVSQSSIAPSSDASRTGMAWALLRAQTGDTRTLSPIAGARGSGSEEASAAGRLPAAAADGEVGPV